MSIPSDSAAKAKSTPAASLSIIIVNWNGINFLPTCLKSIVTNPPGVSYEIVVVDNASSDGSIDWLRSDEVTALFPNGNLKVVESKENLGFGRANNLVIDHTTAPFVFLLNPDTVVKGNAIDKLLETIQSSRVIGAVGPKLLNPDGTLQPSVWGFPPSPLSILVEGLKLHRVIPNFLLRNWLYAEHWSYDERRPVPLVSAAAILAKREMIEKVGGFDESFHMYGEDMEWCIRIERAGWKIYFEPDAEVFHVGGQSSLQRWTNLERGNVQEEASIRFQQKYLSRFRMFTNSLAKTFVVLVHFARWRYAGKNTSALGTQIRMQLTACRRFLFGLKEK